MKTEKFLIKLSKPFLLIIKNSFFYVLIIVSLTTCKSQKNSNLYFSQKPCSENVIAKFDESGNVKIVKIPIEVELNNKTSENFDLTSYKYSYSGFNKSKGNKPILYFIKEDERIKFDHSKINTIKKNTLHRFFFVTQHFVDSIQFPKEYFIKDSTRLKLLKKNGLTIKLGDSRSFKKNYNELYKFLFRSDTLTFKFYNKSRVKVPINN